MKRHLLIALVLVCAVVAVAYAGTVENFLDEQDASSGIINLRGNDPLWGPGEFDVSVEITGNATVELQRSFDYTGNATAATWGLVKQYDASAEEVGKTATRAHFRFVLTSETADGNATVRIAQ